MNRIVEIPADFPADWPESGPVRPASIAARRELLNHGLLAGCPNAIHVSNFRQILGR
jgi:hypothetical protein